MVVCRRYIDNAVQKLTQKLELSSKNLEKSRVLKEKEAELAREARDIASQIPPLISYTRSLQSKVCETLDCGH